MERHDPQEMKSLTLGKRIQRLRKEAGLTQDALAERMGVTPQAVSKWENDLCCPDILSLPALAQALHATADTLLTGSAASPDTSPEAPAKPAEELIVRMCIATEDGDRFSLNLPFTVFRLTVLYDMLTFSASIKEGDVRLDEFLRALTDLDLKHIVRMIEAGARGVLVDAGTVNRLTVWVE